jgi:hypothetical protein
VVRARRVVATLAFVGHYPALRTLTPYRFTRATSRLNVLAIAVTVGAMVTALLASGRPCMVLAWLIGHVAWGSVLAARVLCGDGMRV